VEISVTTPRFSTYYVIRLLIKRAAERGKEQTVSRELVGALLEMLCGKSKNKSKATSRVSSATHLGGDFKLGNTVFVVRVAPDRATFDRCKANLRMGLQVYLLVPESRAVGAKQNAKLIAQEITVVSIEAFISQNIDELGEFDSRLRHEQISRLLLTYNKRVDAVESDKSLLIKIPRALQQAADQAL